MSRQLSDVYTKSSFKYISHNKWQKVRKNFRWQGASLSSPSEYSWPPEGEGEKLHNHNENQYWSTLSIKVYVPNVKALSLSFSLHIYVCIHIYIYIIKTINEGKLLWHTFGCKVGQNDSIATKLKFEAWQRLVYIYIYIYIYICCV